MNPIYLGETYISLNSQILLKEEQLRQLKNKLRSLPGVDFIKEAYQNAEANLTVHPTDELVKALLQTDEPLTRIEIEQVLAASGFGYDEEHIDACKPASRKAVAEWISEQRRQDG